MDGGDWESTRLHKFAAFMEKFNAKIGYNVGLLNRYTGNLDDLSFRTGVFYVGVGINF